ncbi:MAG: hypothetical protein O7G32_10975 [SAR324 cluster bacterium]|nr:hypothetical protein [SAR324 cluster bacterium]
MSDSLQALHEAHQAVLSDIAGKALPLGYGDFEGEVTAIEEGLGVLVMEASELLLVRGAEAEAFLNGLTTNDLKTLSTGAAQNNLLCGIKGKLLHHLLIVRSKAEEFLVIAEPGEGAAVASHLERYHIREELQLGTVGLLRVDLLGPLGAAALEGLGLAPGATQGEFAGGPLLAPSSPLGELPRRLALLPAGNAPALVEALLETSPQARLVGFEAFDEARLWAGMPRAGADYGPDHLPAEAAIYDHISFDKGCYVGQEIHARMHYRGHANRKLTGVTIPEQDAAGLTAGSELYLEQRAVGALTSLSRLVREGQRRGIAMLRCADIQERPLLAVTAGGPTRVALWALSSDLGVARA